MDLTNRIKDRISNADGKIGIYFCDINKNDSCFVGNCDVFPSLGVAKLVLMIEVFKQVEEGIIKLDDEYELEKNPPFAIPEDEYESTVGVLDFLHKGMKLHIEDLLYMMIVISDNSAFNILLSIVGIDNVNETMKKLGLIHTKIGCMLFEWEERNPERDNYHSVREVGSLLKRLYKRQLISSSASEKMLKMLSYHQRRDILSQFSNDNVSVAQQTGFDVKALHEVAVVMTPEPFIICMSVAEMDAKRAEGIMKDVAAMCGKRPGNDRRRPGKQMNFGEKRSEKRTEI